MSPATTEVTPPLAVEHDVDDEVAAGHAGDPGVFLVDRVAVEDAAVGLGVLEKLRAVPDLDGFERGDSRADQLAAAGIAGHQVRLDQAGGDLQVGPNVAGVDPGGTPRGVVPRKRMLVEARAVMVLDAIARRRSPRPTISSFSAGVLGRCRPVAMRIRIWSRAIPASCKTLSVGPRIVRLGTGRVMSQIRMQASFRPRASSRNGGAFDRLIECMGHGRFGVFQRGHVANGQRTNHALRGQFDIQPRASIIQGESQRFHGLPGQEPRWLRVTNLASPSLNAFPAKHL